MHQIVCFCYSRIVRSVYIEQNSGGSRFDSGDSWTILSPLEQSIKKKIETFGVPLKDKSWGININYGVKTGLNEAFIIDGAKRAELIAADPKSAEIIRPILRGKDIKRYSYDFADQWLIAAHNGNKDKDIFRIDVKKYPAVKKHLDNFFQKIEKRQDKGDTPYNLRSCAYWEDFSKQKIVWGNLCLKAQYSFVKEEFYINAPSPMIVPGSLYLLAVMNSKIADFYIRSLGVTRNGGYFEYKPMFVEKLPIPLLSNDNQKNIINIVKKIISAKENGMDTFELETLIESILYSIFNFTKNEIQLLNQY